MLNMETMEMTLENMECISGCSMWGWESKLRERFYGECWNVDYDREGRGGFPHWWGNLSSLNGLIRDEWIDYN